MRSISTLKSAYSPELYYPKNLSGAFGKSTCNGWYQWNGLCPFHNDKRVGSLVINKATGSFKCFSCGARGGDIIDFHALKNRMGIKEAVNQLWRNV